MLLAIFGTLLLICVVVYAMFAIASSQLSARYNDALNEYQVPYEYNYYHNVYNDDH